MAPITNRPQLRLPTPPRNAPQQPPARPRTAPPQTLLQQGVSFFEQNRSQLARVGTAGLRANAQITDARNAYRRAQRTGNAPNRQPVTFVRNSTSTLGRALRPARIGGSLFGFANNVRRLPGQGATAFRDIRTALRSGSTEDRVRAERSSRQALHTASTIADTAATARRNLRAATFAAPRLARQYAPQLTQRLGTAATRLAESSAGRLAMRVLTNGAVTSTARVAARTAGRFVPGVNYGIAALDIREARRALADPNASTGRRVTSVITALGSSAAASNIPVVSQIGGAIATVSSAIGAFFS